MKKHSVLLLVFMLVCSLGAHAQALKSSYFMENSYMRNKLNPAFTPRANYISFPALGNLGVGVNSNFGIANFVFPKNGETYTYLNDQVSAEEFDSALPQNPFLNVNVDLDVLDFGFYVHRNGFLTFQAGAKVDVQTQLARELFTLAKLGAAHNEGVYDLNNFNVFQSAHAYAAIGYTHDFSDLVPGLKVGLKGKFLVGADYIDMKMGESQITMSPDLWSAKTDATAHVAATFLDLEMTEDSFNANVDPMRIRPAGYGYAFDFGVEYKLKMDNFFDGLSFSFAALDLGSITYKMNNVQTFRSAGEAQFAGLTGITFDDYDFEQAFGEVKDDFMSMANLEETSTQENLRVSTQPQILAGVKLPLFRDRMSFGLLYSNQFAYVGPVSSLTVAYSLTPWKWLNLGVNYSILDHAKALGWILEIAPANGLSFFIGSDMTCLEFSPQYLPVDRFAANGRFGLNIVFSRRHRQ